MEIIGIIAEYNPFHNGHAYMINEIRRQTPTAAIIAAMSGSVTQRGEVAIVDKWQRARMAVVGGVDLVLELPTAFVLASAQNFALGGVGMLNRLGCVDKIAFGAECSDLAKLKAAAEFLDGREAQEKIRAVVKKGHSYGAAARSVIAEYTSVGLPKSNTVLALEYLRALKKLAASIVPLAIQRRGVPHLSTITSGRFAGGATIRQMILAENNLSEAEKFLPPPVALLLREHNFAANDYLFVALLSRLAMLSQSEIATYIGIGEGLEQRLLRAVKNAGNWQETVGSANGKRYHAARINRAMLGILLKYTQVEQQNFLAAGAMYGRVLAFNSVGREILNRVKRHGELPLVTRLGSHLNRRDFWRDNTVLTLPQQMLKLDIKATLLQNMAQFAPQFVAKDYLNSPFYANFRQ